MFRQMWKQFDLNGDGVIDEYEFLHVLRKLNPSWTEEQAQQLMKAYDGDGNGYLEYSEFFNWLFDEGRWYKKESKSKKGKTYYVNADTGATSWTWPPYSDGKTRSSLQAVLVAMDKDGDGTVTPTEFIGAMMALDKDGDGVIQRSELPETTGAYQKGLFDLIDTESSVVFLATGADDEAHSLNGPYHEAGMYNGRNLYKNKTGGIIRWEVGAQGDWSVQNVGVSGQPKWVAYLDGQHHYFRDFRDIAVTGEDQAARSLMPPVSMWESVQHELRYATRRDGVVHDKYSADFSLSLYKMSAASGGDGLLSVKELTQAFAKFDKDRNGDLSCAELKEMAQ